MTEPLKSKSGPRKPIAGIGRVLLWNGGSLWIGRDVGRGQPHAHHALQITLALNGPFLLTDQASDAWTPHLGTIVLPDHPHQFDGCGRCVAQMFVEPETRLGRSLLACHGAHPITTLPDATVERLVTGIRDAYTAGATDAVMVAAARESVGLLAGETDAPAEVDPRISLAIEWIRTRLGTPFSLAEAAAVAHLSPSRFRHLFVAQTGVSLRAYVLWARMESAVAAAMAGKSWTEVAQLSGFADSAHLSRTCRRMLGCAPAMLIPESMSPPILHRPCTRPSPP